MSSEFLDNIPFLVNLEDDNNLMKPFSKKEIVEVIWAMESDKAPSSNGFSIPFYKVCWPIIKSNLIRMVSAFQKKGKLAGEPTLHFYPSFQRRLILPPLIDFALFHYAMLPIRL